MDATKNMSYPAAMSRNHGTIPRLLIPAALAVVALFAAAQPAAAFLEPHVRDGWTVGVAYGTARGEVEVSNGEVDAFQDGVSPQIRVGHSIGRHFSFGASYAGWMFEEGELPIKLRLSMQNILAALTWYPGDPERALGGFYMRGGLGVAWTRITAVEIKDDEEQGHGEHLQESGLGAELTLGYEFRVARTVALGMALGVHNLSIQGDVFTDASFVPVTFTGTWYW
jgi:hypothetical protein